jgi:hypothetical protein
LERTRADREVALKVLEGKPKVCYFCKKIEGENWVAHHINGNFKDNREENLAWAHHSCHSSKHNEGHKVSQKVRDAVAQRNKNRVWTEEMRTKLANSHRGRRKSKETRLKMAESQQVAWTNRKTDRRYTDSGYRFREG